MSGFDKTLRGLSGREMLECARGLLECLTGGGDGAARGAGEIAGIGPVERAGAGPAAETARRERWQGERGALSRRGDAYEYGLRDGPDGRGDYEWETADAGRGGGRGGDVPAEHERRAAETRGGAARTAPSVAAPGAGPGASSGAAFCGPERRYDGAVGARGMEMSRVSEFFRRDSRRYDAGCALK